MGTFQTFLRIQYSVIGSQARIAELFDQIAAQQISITAYVIERKQECTHLHFVVGLPDSTNPIWDREVIELLNTNCYRYGVKNIVQVSGIPPGTVGVIRTIYGGLFCQVKIYRIYLGEATHRFIDSDEPYKVMEILSQVPIKQCPRCN